MSEHGHGGGHGAPAMPLGGHGMNQAAQAFGQGALMGAAIGAMIGASRAVDTKGEVRAQAPVVTKSALQEATRLGVAAGMGAAVASMVPAGGTVRALTMVAVGAAVLAANSEDEGTARSAGKSVRKS
jgi:hypothetical protein